MNEAGVWNTLKTAMLGRWHATRIESSSSSGVPDVTYGIKNINGWIELKYIKAWRKLPTTKVKLPLEPEQLHWIVVRGNLSGNVWAFIRIEDDFFLLNHVEAARAYDGLTKDEWFKNCSGWWRRSIDPRELYSILIHGWKS